MKEGNRMEVGRILKQYKLPNGYPDYVKLFDIPKSERISSLAQVDFKGTNMIIVAALTMAFENLNVKRGLNELQILNLSEILIESAEEDNISLEDFMLFLSYFVRGKYPMSYESLDIPKFMKAFDLYRDERWQEGIKIRDEKVVQWKGLGDANRTSTTDALSEHMSNISGRISDMKEALREQKEMQTMKKAAEYFKDK